MSSIDTLAIGHVCKDTTPQGARLGGTVTFSTLTARAMGLRAAILTSAPPTSELLEPLHGIPLEIIPADDFTTFENTYTLQGRTQRLLGHAKRIRAADLPEGWRDASIVHIAPVANEVDAALIEQFPDALIGVTPQGWMRQWDSLGRVAFQRWEPSAELARLVNALVMSIEDVQGNEEIVADYASRFRLLVVTRGADGCTVYENGQEENIAAPEVKPVDPTGAGDIFAAVFFARLHATHDAIAAARIATQLASDSVMRVGLESIPDSQLLRTLWR